jgi:hypothetical protein
MCRRDRVTSEDSARLNSNVPVRWQEAVEGELYLEAFDAGLTGKRI